MTPQRPSNDVKNEGYGYAGLGMATAAATEVTVNTVGGFSELVTFGTVGRATLRSYSGLDNKPSFYGPRSFLGGQGPGRVDDGAVMVLRPSSCCASVACLAI